MSEAARLPGDVMANYVGLHESTGESYKSMADRVEAAGGHPGLVKWLHDQKDTHTARQKAGKERAEVAGAGLPTGPGAAEAPVNAVEEPTPTEAKARGRRTTEA